MNDNKTTDVHYCQNCGLVPAEKTTKGTHTEVDLITDSETIIEVLYCLNCKSEIEPLE
jgi:hypothetical protein